MHTVQLQLDDTIMDRFMQFIDTLPQKSVSIEEIDSVPYYPAISFEEAQTKVARSLANIDKNEGIESNEFFNQLLK